MAFDVNRITLLGRLGKDAELDYTRNDTPYAKFSMATGRRWKNDDGEWEEETTWHNVIVWGNSAEFASKLGKGERCYVEGRQEHRSYEDRETGETKYYASVVAQRVIRLDWPEEGEDEKPRRAKKAAPKNTRRRSQRSKRSAGSDSDDLYRGKEAEDDWSDSDDDLPF